MELSSVYLTLSKPGYFVFLTPEGGEKQTMPRTELSICLFLGVSREIHNYEKEVICFL